VDYVVAVLKANTDFVVETQSFAVPSYRQLAPSTFTMTISELLPAWCSVQHCVWRSVDDDRVCV
jgi:hypothetical protein